MQTGIISFLTLLLGASVMYNLKPGYNLTELANRSSTVIPNATFIYNVSQSIGEIKEELLQCQAHYTAVEEIKKELLQCQANYTFIGKVQEKLGHCQDNLTEIQTKMTDDFFKLKRDVKIVTGQQEIYGNGSTSVENILFILVGQAVEGVIFMLLFKYWQSRKNTTHQGQEKNTDNGTTEPIPSQLLETVEKVPLENSVCIVSFYKETQELHKRLTKSAIQADIPIKQFLMKSPETQLKSIPKSKYILVFVDYNERNIILETCGQDLGDKKLVTVQAAQKMGADVCVVYVRDRGSTNLPDGVLYNTNLASFTRHPILGKLTVRDRGLSVYETFSVYQKSHINKIIS